MVIKKLKELKNKNEKYMEHNTQHNIISDSMIEAAENIRKVEIADAKAIVDIYNYYVENTAVSFETEALTVNEMAERIKEISSQFPYFVYEKDGKILGYCYAHQWKERAAYSKTLETTIYIDKDVRHQGLGRIMVKLLIDLCRNEGYRALIACITQGNEASIKMHESLGFKQVSEFKEVGFKFDTWLDVVDLELLL